MLSFTSELFHIGCQICRLKLLLAFLFFLHVRMPVHTRNVDVLRWYTREQSKHFPWRNQHKLLHAFNWSYAPGVTSKPLVECPDQIAPLSDGRVLQSHVRLQSSCRMRNLNSMQQCLSHYILTCFCLEGGPVVNDCLIYAWDFLGVQWLQAVGRRSLASCRVYFGRKSWNSCWRVPRISYWVM